jgi:hypothetical protein
VVARQDEHEVRVLLGDRRRVPSDGIGRARVPAHLVGAGEIWLQDADAGAEGPVQIPGAPTPDVVDQRAGAVLGEDEDAVDPRVHAVRQGEVDDPVLAPERDRRLGAMIGEDGEAFTRTSGKDDGDDVHRALPTTVALAPPGLVTIIAAHGCSSRSTRRLQASNRAAR